MCAEANGKIALEFNKAMVKSSAIISVSCKKMYVSLLYLN